MADSIEVDFTELIELAEDFEKLAATLPARIVQAVEHTAYSVSDDAKDAVLRRHYFKGAASAIDYEMKGVSGAVSSIDAEVGYNKSKRGGRLGNLLEYGAPNAPRMMNVPDGMGGWKTVPVPGGGKRPLAPGGELQASLSRNEEDLQRGVEKAIDDAMRDARL